jgi:PKD repeat protein
MLFTFTGNVPSPPVTTNYKWYFPDGDSASLKDPSKLLTKPGLNKVTLTNLSSNGCKNSITKDVDILTQAKADFNTKDVCEDSLVFFNNSSKDGVTYRWKFGDGNSSKEVSPFHKYIISGVSKTFNVSLLAVVPNGCSDSITKPITVNANPNSDFLFTISGRLVSFTAVENNASKYEWTFGDGGTTNSSNNITSYHFTKFPSGKYSACLKVTNAANCFTETCKEVNITGAIDKLPNESNIKLYPNPNSGDFTIAFSNPQNHINIEVYDFLGHLIQQVSPPTSQSLCLINLNVTSGIYLLRITNGQKIFMQKITVQK